MSGNPLTLGRQARQVVMRAFEGICGLAVWGMVLLLGLGALERNLVKTSLFANTGELMGYLMAALFSLGLSVALRHDGHVRVDTFYRKYRTSTRRVMDGIFRVIGIGAAVALAAAGGTLARDSLRRGRVDYGLIDVPLWLPQLLIVLGALALATEFVLGSGNGAGDEPRD